MDSGRDNPATNQLSAGVTEGAVRSAVDESGYPLQVFVSDLLRNAYFVQEEWAYVDRDTGDLRSMDLRARKSLFDLQSQPRVRPVLNLLIECKQSELPYVFFESKGSPRSFEHPVIHGLHKSSISIITDDSRSTWNFSIVRALGLTEHPFQLAQKTSRTFSKCVRKGQKLELSGTDAYSHLILPLVKALEHLGSLEKPVETAVYFDAHLSVALGILDAPMMTARSEPGGTVLEFAPWVRVIRHEYASSEFKHARDRHWMVDVIHKDFLKEYLELHLEPFANEFAKRVLRHPTEIATSRAFASGMEQNSWTDIEARLRPGK